MAFAMLLSIFHDDMKFMLPIREESEIVTNLLSFLLFLAVQARNTGTYMQNAKHHGQHHSTSNSQKPGYPAVDRR